MPSTITQDIRTGLYSDYSKNFMKRENLLVTTRKSQLIINFMGLLVPIALMRAVAVWHHLYSLKHPLDRGADTPEGRGWDLFRLGLREFLNRPPNLPAQSPTAGVHAPTAPVPGPANPFPEHNRPALGLVAMGVLWGIYYAIALGSGIVTAYLATDSTMLSNSVQCGIYLPSASLAPTPKPVDWNEVVLPYVYEVELESSNWAKKCYSVPDGTDGCGYLVQRQIPYKTVENVSCPFENDMCYDGANSAIGLYTPPVSASVLGINAPQTFEIRRCTECAPINRNETFIRRTQNGSSIVFTYHYGQSGTWAHWGNFTHRTTSDGKLLNVATYDMQAMISGSDYWKPLPSLQPPPGGVTTLLFILVGKLYHPEQRDDPVFPADRVQNFLGTGGVRSWWVNSLGHATLLGCVDRTEWRDPTLNKTWSPYSVQLQKRPKNPKVRAGAWLLWYSIQNSNVFYAVNARSAGALDAQARISRLYQSLPLAKEQWKVEARQLFETSLARIQMNVKAVSRGEGARYPDLGRWEPLDVTDGDPVSICDGTYLFHGDGYSNILFWPWLCVLIPCALLLVGSIPLNGQNPNDDELLGIKFYKAISKVWNVVWPWLRDPCQWLGKKIWTVMKDPVWPSLKEICRNTKEVFQKARKTVQDFTKDLHLRPVRPEQRSPHL